METPSLTARSLVDATEHLPHHIARVVLIAPDGQDTIGCGLVRTSTCASLAFVLTTIVQPNDQVEFASGTYVANGPTIVFGDTALQNLTIRSARDNPMDVTIDRAYQGRLFEFTGTETTWFVSISGIRFVRGGWTDPTPDLDYAGALMRLASNARISFTQCRFEANLNPKFGYAGRGGVGAITVGTPQFTNCYFSDNWEGVAGTFYIGGTSTPLFDDCVFENSGCHVNGWGGVVVPEDQSSGVWQNCVFRNNTCSYGGAIDDGGTATPRFVGCTFENNFGRNIGGMYYGFGGSSTTFDACRFVGNRIAKGGNGQDFYLSSNSAPVFQNCVFDSGPNPVTVADGGAGAVKDNALLMMVGCTIRGYRASYGTVHFSVSATGTIDSCLIVDNKCVRGGAIGAQRSILVRNSTFRNNEANEGGAISIYSMSTTVQVRIEDSLFEDNISKTSGGAIRASGAMGIEVVRTRFIDNHATSQGGGAMYSGSDVDTVINHSTFIDNSSPLGGAIWSGGVSLVALDSVFEENVLATTTDNVDDSCAVVDGQTGGAIYVMRSEPILSDSELTTTSPTCVMDDLRLTRLEFRGNSAGDGGGGAIFVDGRLPPCVVDPTQVCVGCSFSNNSAAYGQEIATAVSSLELVASDTLESPWTLMAPKDIVLGANDRFGHQLAGNHAPMVVRITLTDAIATSVLPVRLVSNNSRVFRNGVATFKSASFQMPHTFVTNTIDRTLNLTFSSDTLSVTVIPSV